MLHYFNASLFAVALFDVALFDVALFIVVGTLFTVALSNAAQCKYCATLSCYLMLNYINVPLFEC